jgi:hypothetical protein
LSRKYSSRQNSLIRRQFQEQSQERKEKKQGKLQAVQKVEFNFSNLKNIVPDDEVSPKIAIQ